MLRAERLAQLNVLRRVAARGKLSAALAWIDDFLASEEPLVVFAGHREIQEVLAALPGGRCTSSATTRCRRATPPCTRSRSPAGRS